jgi:hypothetical protein
MVGVSKEVFTTKTSIDGNFRLDISLNIMEEKQLQQVSLETVDLLLLA